MTTSFDRFIPSWGTKVEVGLTQKTYFITSKKASVGINDFFLRVSVQIEAISQLAMLQTAEKRLQNNRIYDIRFVWRVTHDTDMLQGDKDWWRIY